MGWLITLGVFGLIGVVVTIIILVSNNLTVPEVKNIFLCLVTGHVKSKEDENRCERCGKRIDKKTSRSYY